MNNDQLDKLKEDYANLIVDGMDMNTLITFAVETIIHNMEMWDEEDVKGEIVELYGEETLNDLLPEINVSELETTANNYTTGK
jgi:hypothetical protein|nr:hypothetical protein [uncultured Mediterranean phage uvMED]|tara:strand:- start:150 stop:398 length:249 start_codon:yes stop_codon:yes gene_type:complete